MKRSIPAIALASGMLFSAATASAATPTPDLTGNWETKTYGHHHEEKGYLEPGEGSGKWSVKEQKGRFFHGERTYVRKRLDNKTVTEGFSGVISRDGKHLYMVDHDEDILFGDILDDGSIELIMLNDGDENSSARIGILEIEKAK